MNENFSIVTRPVEGQLVQPRDVSGASGDEDFVNLWLSRYRSVGTRRAYKFESDRWMRQLAERGLGLRTVNYKQATEIFDALTEGLAPATALRCVSAIKSLYSRAMKLGYLQVNVVAAIDSPRVPNKLAERILSKEEVYTLFAAAKPDERFALKLMYLTGARVSEVAAMKWRDLIRREGGRLQATILGKGQKTRFVLLPASLSKDMEARRGEADDFVVPVGRSKSSNILSRSRMLELMLQSVADRAGFESNPSPHWLRHSHASHALDAGARVHTIKETLGHGSVAVLDRYLHARPGESSGDFLGE